MVTLISCLLVVTIVIVLSAIITGNPILSQITYGIILLYMIPLLSTLLLIAAVLTVIEFPGWVFRKLTHNEGE